MCIIVEIICRLFVLVFVFAEAPGLKRFNFVERKSQREMLHVMLNNAGLSTCAFSGSVYKLQLTVS